MNDKNFISNIIKPFSSLDFNIAPFLPLSIMFFGFKKMKGIIMENSFLKDLDKKDVFNYLICNRVFIDNLSDKEIKEYKKFFIALNRLRFKEKIFNFFKFI